MHSNASTPDHQCPTTQTRFGRRAHHRRRSERAPSPAIGDTGECGSASTAIASEGCPAARTHGRRESSNEVGESSLARPRPCGSGPSLSRRSACRTSRHHGCARPERAERTRPRVLLPAGRTVPRRRAHRDRQRLSISRRCVTWAWTTASRDQATSSASLPAATRESGAPWW